MRNVILLAAVYIVWACSGLYGHAQDKNAENLQRPIVVIAGADSHVHKPFYQRVTTSDALHAIWARHLGTSVDDAYRPTMEVDFDRYMVVAALLGDKVNVRGLEVHSVFDNAGSLTIRVERLSYQTGSKGDTRQPYAFIVLPKTGKRIVLEENTQNYKGGAPVWKQLAVVEEGRSGNSEERKPSQRTR